MRSRVSALCPFVLKYKYLLHIICRHRSPRGRASTLTLCPAGADTSLRGSDTLPACQRGTLNAGHIEPATALPRTPIGTALEIGEPNQERQTPAAQWPMREPARRPTGKRRCVRCARRGAALRSRERRARALVCVREFARLCVSPESRARACRRGGGRWQGLARFGLCVFFSNIIENIEGPAHFRIREYSREYRCPGRLFSRIYGAFLELLDPG